MSRSEIEAAEKYFNKGYNCAQALLAAFGPGLGLDRANAVKVAGAFGSGMGTGDTCGAVTGALMVLGLKHSRTIAGFLMSRERTDEAALEFVARFNARNSSTICRGLLGCNVNSSEGAAEAKKAGHFKKRCPQFVRDAAEILDEMLGSE